MVQHHTPKRPANDAQVTIITAKLIRFVNSHQIIIDSTAIFYSLVSPNTEANLANRKLANDDRKYIVRVLATMLILHMYSGHP